MFYLAQVQRKSSDSKPSLHLLACQKAEHTWVPVEAECVPLPEEGIEFGDRAMVIVMLSSNQQVSEIRDAKDWVLEVVEQYLTTGISPQLLKEEVQRAEQWRQSLTLQSQELGRRALEMEARRDQMQELEENLKREKQQQEASVPDKQGVETQLSENANTPA